MTTLDDHAASRRSHRSFSGELIDRDHPSYDAARQVWNGEIQRRPGLIARCRGAADVVAAVRFAREQRPARLRPRRRPRGRRARRARRRHRHRPVGDDAAPGSTRSRARSRPRAAASTRTSTGRRQAFGLAVDRRVRQPHRRRRADARRRHRPPDAEVRAGDRRAARRATSSPRTGRSSRPAPSENPDLFWGLRGGGGNFGVVTNFTFDLQPLGPTILAGLIAWPADQAPDGARVPARLHRRRARRARADGQPAARAAAAGVPRGGARQADRRADRHLGRRHRGGRAVLRAAARPRHSARRRDHARSRTSRTRRCSTRPCRTAGTTTGSRTGSGR